jgi:arylformamidase
MQVDRVIQRQYYPLVKLAADNYPSMRIYDVSVPLSAETPAYPGDPGIEISAWKSLANGDSANVSLIRFGAHSGTHVDAPSHFIKGAAGVKSLPLEVLIGEVQVVEVPGTVQVIDLSFVREHCQQRSQRLIFKTRNSSFWGGEKPVFHSDFTHLDPGAAEYLVSQGIRLVGIDYLSIEKFKSKNHETHVALLSKGVVILEGLDLREVSGGSYELICLPLRLVGGNGDGAPARVVLRTLT